MIKVVQAMKITFVVGSIMAVGIQTHCALPLSVCDLKAAHINVKPSLIRQLMLYEFELSHNAVEATENICCEKVEGTVDRNTVTG